MAAQIRHHPVGTPDPPQWDPSFNPVTFLADYDYWCTASGLNDENVLAAKFAYSFMGQTTLRRAIQTIYDNTQTWTQMKRQCIELLREVCNQPDNDYESALTVFESPSSYQKYDEPIALYARRWNDIYTAFARARAAEGLAPFNTREQLLHFRARLTQEMQTLCLKKKATIRNIQDAVALIKGRELFNKSNRRSLLQRASLEIDPCSQPLNTPDSFAKSQDAPPNRGNSNAPSAAARPPLTSSLAFPARAGLYGPPDGQLESNATIRTRMWTQHNQALEKALEDRDKKLAEFEAKLTALEKKSEAAPTGRADDNDKQEEKQTAKRLTVPSRACNSDFAQVLPFPPETMPEPYRIYVSLTDSGQRCLWCNVADHNTQSCPRKCARCSQTHSVYFCPSPYTDFKCSGCGISGHCIESCVWRLIGPLKNTSKYGAQPPPRDQMQQFHGQQNPQQDPRNPTGFQGSYQDNHHNRQGRGGHGGYNRNKRHFAQIRQATDDGDKQFSRGGNFQQGVMNKKLKEQENNLLAKIQENSEKQQREFDRLTKLIQQNQNAAALQPSHDRDRNHSSRSNDSRSGRNSRKSRRSN